jgi:hypothetical protein
MIRTKVVTYEEEVPSNLEDFKAWEFSSGGITGEDFIVFARKFKSYIKSQLDASLLNYSRGHYILSGFIRKHDKFVYFSISDVRHFPSKWVDDILIRTAQSEEDYTGGANCYTSLLNFQRDVEGLLG